MEGFHLETSCEEVSPSCTCVTPSLVNVVISQNGVSQYRSQHSLILIERTVLLIFGSLQIMSSNAKALAVGLWVARDREDGLEVHQDAGPIVRVSVVRILVSWGLYFYEDTIQPCLGHFKKAAPAVP